jgi:hypothetical protein
VWRSLVAHSLWERGAVGSNPATPTRYARISQGICPIPRVRSGWPCHEMSRFPAEQCVQRVSALFEVFRQGVEYTRAAMDKSA